MAPGERVVVRDYLHGPRERVVVRDYLHGPWREGSGERLPTWP